MLDGMKMLPRAEKDLNEIYAFCSNISYNYAEKIQNKIINYILSLYVFPRGYPKIFQENIKYEYRKIPIGRYQIIYTIYKKYIFIVSIFDTRQNPKINY